MKRTTHHSPAGIFLALTLATGLPLAAQTIDPDPELFDGTRTKKDKIEQNPAKTVDQWQEANLILYDSNEQGSQQGGQGRAGFENPGFAEGVQGGAGMQGGIPMPMGGGAGSQSNQPIMPGMIPTAGQSTPTAGTPPGQNGQPGQPGGPPSGKPGEVSIGDPNQQIAAQARPVSKVGSGVPPPPTGEEAKESKGEETTSIPNSASGQQSNQRGSGVEKGDAMPTDI